MKHSINYYLGQANNLRFKMLAIVGNNENKKIEIIDYLKKKDWTLIDVESELLKIRDLLNKNEQSDEVLISETLKKWFETKPNKVILTNADILYHDYFQKISPIAAFKYRTRNKQTVIFLDNEKLLGNRIIKDKAVGEYHTDQLTALSKVEWEM